MTRFERNTGRLLLLWLTAFAAGGCQIQRSIPEGAYLLDKNTIKCDRAEFRESLEPIIKQQPNRKILGLFRFHLGVYSMADRGKSTKTKQWLKTAVGEAPVLMDKRLT
ncbi:MAG: outer membrane protein assembly factor, partial [Bacteroidota bacterium]